MNSFSKKITILRWKSNGEVENLIKTWRQTKSDVTEQRMIVKFMLAPKIILWDVGFAV